MLSAVAAFVVSATIVAMGLGVLFLTLFFFHGSFQDHVIYCHALKQSTPAERRHPELVGFLRNQVTLVPIRTPDGETLSTWHILPLGLYHRHRHVLGYEATGLQLLRDDPDAVLVIFFHGVAGSIASAFRPQACRSISALSPGKIHVLAVDYRGFGDSTGSPSEAAIKIDAIAAAEWAMSEARIPPSRIVLFGQSLGTAVSLALAQQYSSLPKPIFF